MYRKTALAFVLCISLFVLTACAGKQGEHIDTLEESPFEAMGLLAHPGETPEELLMRAHTYDPQAKLAVTDIAEQTLEDRPTVL